MELAEKAKKGLASKSALAAEALGCIMIRRSARR
jgi:hypothetical protein